MQYWSQKNPCLNCGADSNTNHVPECRNYDLYDADGRAIPAEKRPVMIIDGLEIPEIGLYGVKNMKFGSKKKEKDER